jgi:hypothetical protein
VLLVIARAYPEESQKPTLIPRFCTFEKCPVHIFLTAAHCFTAPASSITLRLE